MANNMFSSLDEELDGIDWTDIPVGPLPDGDLVDWLLEESSSGLPQAAEGEGQPVERENPQPVIAPERGSESQDVEEIMLNRCLEPWEPHEDLKAAEEQYFMARCLSPWVLTQDGSGIPLTSKSCYIYFNVVLYTNIRPGICL